MTPPGAYRRLLERHLRETRAPRRAPLESASRARPSLADAARPRRDRRRAAPHARQGPARPAARRDRHRRDLLKNANDECATEALEIATYDAIEALAQPLGDRRPPLSPRAHREDEERMLADLRALIPGLAAGSTADARAPDRGLRRAQRRPGRRPPSELGQDDLADRPGLRARPPQPAHGRSSAPSSSRRPRRGRLRRGRHAAILNRSTPRSRAPCATTRAATAAAWRSSRPPSRSSAAPLDRGAAQAAARLRYHAPYRGWVRPPRRTSTPWARRVVTGERRRAVGAAGSRDHRRGMYPGRAPFIRAARRGAPLCAPRAIHRPTPAPRATASGGAAGG